MRAIVMLTAVALVAAPASAGVDEGGVLHDKVPWSGYWWPHARGGLQQPAAKHDDLTGKKAREWEEKNNPKTVGGKLVPGWYGFCHAWAAASVAEKEPRKPVNVAGGDGRQRTLSVAEQKGLLTLCHTADVANSFGERNFGDGRADVNDLSPDELWRLLKLYVQQQHIPLILDTDAGEQVWNYPVYAYRVTYSSTGRPNGETDCQMELFMADDGVYPDYTGTMTRYKQYRFTCQMNGDKVVSGSGKWASTKDHPDFAWYPHTTAAQNPEVDVAAVRKWVDATGVTGTGTVTPGRPVPPGPIPPPGGGGGTGGGSGPFNPDPLRVLAISPQQLVSMIVDKTSAYEFDMAVDKFDGGVYSPGEGYTVSGKCAKDGYVYLFEITPTDVSDPAKVQSPPLRLLYPLPGQDNRVKAKEEFVFPRGDGKGKEKLTFAAGEEIGRYKVKAIFTTRPLQLTGIDYSNQQQQQQQRSSGLRLNEQDQKQTQEAIVQYISEKGKPEQIQQQTLNTKPKDFLTEFSQDECPFVVQQKPGKPDPGKPDAEKPDPKKPDEKKSEPKKGENGSRR